MRPDFQERLLTYNGDVDTEVSATARVSKGHTPDGKLAVLAGEVKIMVGPSTRGSLLPLVSCLMITKNRTEQAKLAVGCYRRQTWPNRELIVLDETPDDRLEAWIQSLSDPTIRFFRVGGSQNILGDLRNRSLDLASGSLICQWDDDDLQHPARLEIGMVAMRAANVPASFLLREMVWMPLQHRWAAAPKRWHENTLLCARETVVRYPPMWRGEDAEAIKKLIARTPTVLLDLPELYVYVVHGRNTWDSSYAPRLWNVCSYRAEGSEADSIEATLSRAYPLADYRALIEARR